MCVCVRRSGSKKKPLVKRLKKGGEKKQKEGEGERVWG